VPWIAIMRERLACYCRDESGATAIEYGLIASLISVTIIAVLTAIGISLREKAMDIAVALANA
jgi:pilus assembly protein Flp/PilA